ncbi:MAG: hypothetical protein ABW022_13010 [Actinoplanes sp.]
MNTADQVGVIVKAWASDEIQQVASLGNDDFFAKGPEGSKVMLVVPGLWTKMDDKLKGLIRARRYAALYGSCPLCNGVGSGATGTFVHEACCGVTDKVLADAIQRWTRRVGSYARGARIMETPQRHAE